jgi:ribosome-associated protein
MNSEELAGLVVKGMQEKKAYDIVVMDLKKVKNAVADYFVLCTANSDTQADAIAESVEKEVHLITKQHAWQKEGKQNREWILIDYVDVVAHVFAKGKRAHYNLENLWGDAEISVINEANSN